jgi:hypothetical protein
MHLYILALMCVNMCCFRQSDVIAHSGTNLINCRQFPGIFGKQILHTITPVF